MIYPGIFWWVCTFGGFMFSVKLQIPGQRSSAATRQYLEKKLSWVRGRFDRPVNIKTVLTGPKKNGPSVYRVEVTLRAGAFSVFLKHENANSYLSAIDGLLAKLRREITEEMTRRRQYKRQCLKSRL